ncbi:hypothetical protein EDC01DRAFT_624108, partial [Geopyxis carbonaria]
MRRVTPQPTARCSQLPLVLGAFKSKDSIRFRRNLRVSSSTFDILLAKVGSNPVFNDDNSRRKQLPVNMQLAIALYRFGHNGSASTVEHVAQWSGVSAGMVVKATRRVMKAVLALHDEVIKWPTEVEKEEAKNWVQSVSCPAWRNGYCMVDGTLIPLFEKPHHYGEAYFDRKSNYSLNVQL